MEKKDQNFIKRENQNLILDLIQAHQLISRAKLAKLAKMSPTTVSRIVASLINIGLVKETNKYTSGVGRKATMLSLNPDSFISIGVELDERSIKFGLFDFLGDMILEDEVGKALFEAPEKVVATIGRKIQNIIEQQQIEPNKITGVCVGIPGFVNNESGIVVKSAQLGWENTLFSELLSAYVDYPIFVDNELKLKAYAERMFDEDTTGHTMVVIGIGSGVGSALIMGNTIYRGYLNSAGEIGHTVVNPNGALCTCGNFGCIQTYIAESFLVQEAKKHDAKIKSLGDIVIQAEQTQKWAINILDRAITYAAITVNNSVCLHNPDKVILTGTTIEQFPYIRDRVIEESKHKIWEPLSDSVNMGISALGEKGVLLGAGMLSHREFIHQLGYEKELV